MKASTNSIPNARPSLSISAMQGAMFPVVGITRSSRPHKATVATSIVLKTRPDAKQQSAAIASLVKMCKQSPVVATARGGITAEVRRDRDRGHE